VNQMIGMFGQMMTWPMTMFGEMMSRSMQTLQTAPWGAGSPCAPQALVCPPCAPERAFSGDTKSPSWSCATGSGSCGTTEDWSCHDRGDDCGESRDGCGCGCGCRSCRSGECCRSSCSHYGSDQVKLVQYSVVDIGRGAREESVCCRQMIIRDCMTAESFRNQVIAEYVRANPSVKGKNLRVYFKVLDCWCKEEWDYEEKQIDVLEEIRDAIGRNDRH
jgi:hypothetical protein